MFEVRAETHDGTILVLRRFDSREAAEDHPVRLAAWKRVWVEEAPDKPPRDVSSPPLPWQVEWVHGRTYVLDANGKKIASLFGTQERREHTAAIIYDRVNRGEQDEDLNRVKG